MQGFDQRDSLAEIFTRSNQKKKKRKKKQLSVGNVERSGWPECEGFHLTILNTRESVATTLFQVQKLFNSF